MTVTENKTIQHESPIEFTTTVLTRFKIRFPQEIICDIEGGKEYHIYLENLSKDTVGKQGVDLPIIRTKGGKLEFNLSHRLRKLFSVGDKVKVKVVSTTEEFYTPNNLYNEKPNELTDFLGKKLSVVFLYKIGENKGLIASEYEKEEELKKLESIEDTYALLTPEKTRRCMERIKIQTEMYNDHAATRFFIKMKKYNLFKQMESFYPVDYYLLIKNQEPITVYVCLMVITTHGLYKFLLASKIVKEFERFLTSKLNIYTVRDKLYELEKKVEKIVYDSFSSRLRKEEEEIDNYFSTRTMLEIMDHSSSYVLKSILALNTNNTISRDEIEEYVEKEYDISDKEYITHSLLYLLEKGIIRRITAVNGKTCFSLVKIDDKKK
ncbi:MAG: hypothetical protein K9W46_10000 [Candidatus Heimdallarchaeum endolithica]|uniref:Uncharacterized protein n=1 Tax=Candidatus Heimdallarchaeum endolithica TaxID=2876572 RepID=A0A9Y1BPL2_9ARCH|nr:MAG: hypothetical protein K9W46_10000 [Candidatus Heimdallarchaeum endolithica]